MKFLGILLKYLLRSLFSIIIFVLLVGLAKMSRNMNSYINFLNNNDRSDFKWTQTSTWSGPFWQNNQISWNIADILSGDVIDIETSGLDVYDPAFEEDFNTFTDTSATGTEEGFWFTTSGQTSSDTSNETLSNTELLNQRKLAQ